MHRGGVRGGDICLLGRQDTGGSGGIESSALANNASGRRSMLARASKAAGAVRRYISYLVASEEW